MKDVKYFRVPFNPLFSDGELLTVYYRFYTIYYTKTPNDTMIQVWDKVNKEWQRTRFDSVLAFTNWLDTKGVSPEEITWGEFQNRLMIEELVG